MCKSEIPLQKVKICAMSVFRSQTPRTYYPPKKQFRIQINISLVSARKGKNKEKYIGWNSKQAKCLENTAFSEDLTDKLDHVGQSFR